jgi:hypothetical protein
MAILATASSGVKRQIIPSDTYLARCYSMIHIGTYQDEYMGEPKIVNKVRFTWELPTELRVFNEASGEQPFVIDKEYTLSMHEKSNLRQDLENWRGLQFTDEEARSFDVTNLLGKYCFLGIIHTTSKKGSEYAKIGTVSKLPKGTTSPPPINPEFIFDYDANFDTEVIASFPDFIKDKIMISNEYKDRINQLEGKELDRKLDAVAAENDDLPF